MRNFHTLEVSDVFKQVKSSANGLKKSEADNRLEKFGQNVLRQENKTSIIKLFLSQFKDFMVLLLVAAAAVSAVIAFLSKDSHGLFDTIIIVFIIFLNATVGFIQQFRADKAIEHLKSLSVGKVKVRRGEQVEMTDSFLLVPGDVVILEEGDMAPADCRIITCNNLKCDESALTGESQPVSKNNNVMATKNAGIGDRKNMMFSSTFVVHGNAEAIVVDTGMDTEIGKIASMIDDAVPIETPLQKSLNTLGKVISCGVIAIAITIFIFGLFFNHNSAIENFMTAVAIAVAAIPEGLPAVVTIIMAMGMQKMSKSKAIVRKLHAVETLGSCNYICSDKTGTLTENKMKVVSIWNMPSFDEHDVLQELYKCMEYCSSVKGHYGNYIGDPTEIALKNCVAESGHKTGPAVVIWEAPFDSVRKCMSVAVRLGNDKAVYTKGAVDILLNQCSRVYDNGQIRDISEDDKQKILSQNSVMCSNALRVLAFATREFSSQISENGLVFLGMCGMMDPPRGEALQAVHECRRAGITPVMITGDHKDTAFAIAKKLEIATSVSEVITGEQIDKLSEKEFDKIVDRCHVFARVSPKHKTMIVKALQKKNNIVAMTGDGINDAPSIKNADIGIAMGISGTDVTKSASDMIIADDNFATIVLAVKEGRRIFANIKKTIQFFLSTNLAEVIAVFFVSVLFSKFNFLLPAQLLWINLVTDSFPVLALGMEKAEPDIMERAPEKAEKSMFSKKSITSICTFGFIMSVITLAVFFVGLELFGNAVASTMTFFTLSFLELFHAFNIRSDKQSILKIGLLSNKALFFTVFGAIVMNVLICFAPVMQVALGVTVLTLSQWLIVFLSSVIIIPIVELQKFVLRRKRKATTKNCGAFLQKI